MSYTFIHLSASDTPRLRDLLAVFGEAFGDHAAYQGAVPDDDYLRRFLGRNHCASLVALAEGRVIGGLVAYELEKFEQARKEIYIYDLAVLDAHRRKGVARGLIGKLKEWARTRGAYVIYVQADVGDEAAIALYTSLGIKEDVHHFDIDPQD
jgi:aminoglycoside 3-N-acetyltransferase I